MNSPTVSVVMSVYNGERYLREAVESILNQTFTDLEFIIIDDGSTDGTVAILTRYQGVDDRIRIYHQKNQGLTASLNRGCRLTRGEYIARMDADDISLSARFAKQVRYLDAHPEIGVLGTWIEYIDENGAPRGNWRMPTAPGVIGWSLTFDTCLAHPSVMMRRDVIERIGFYRPEILQAQDYDLWSRAAFVTRIANVPEILLQRRCWEQSISSRHFQAQEETVVKVMYSMITRLLGSEVPYEAVANLRQMVIGSPLADLQQIELVASLIHQLYRAYLKASSLNRMEAREVAQDAGRKLYTLAVSASKISLWKGFVILVQALRLNPQLLSTRIITKGMRMLVGRS